MIEKKSLQQKFYRRKRWLGLFVTILGLVISGSVILSKPAYATCTGGSSVSGGFLAGWCADNGYGNNTDYLSMNGPRSVQAGTTATFTFGYNSRGGTPAGTHVIGWTQIPYFNQPGESLSATDNGGSSHEVFNGTCFNVVASGSPSGIVGPGDSDGPQSGNYSTSPYYNQAWRISTTSNGGGVVFCDNPTPPRTALPPSSYWENNFIPPGGTADNVSPNNIGGSGGSSVVWYQDHAVNGTSYAVNLNIPSNISGQLCLRYHISVTKDPAIGGGIAGGSANPQQMTQDDLPDIVGIMGDGGGNFNWCFQITPPPPPPPPPSTGVTCNAATVDPPANPRTETIVSVTDNAGNTLAAATVHHTDPQWTATFVPSGQTVTMTYYGRHHNANGTWTNGATRTLQAGPCYSATCSLKVVGNVPRGPSNGVIANQPFTVNASITNTSPSNLTLPATIGGYHLSLTNTSPNSPNNLDGIIPGFGGIGPGATANFQLTLIAPASGSYSISYYPDYWGDVAMAGLGSVCGGSANPSSTVNVYQHFTLEPHATDDPAPSFEDPTTVNYSAYVVNKEGPAVDAPTTSKFYEIPFGGVESDKAGPVPNGGPWPAATSTTYTLGPSTYTVTGPLSAGDQYCTRIDIGYTTGYVGPGGPGDVVDADTPRSANPCFKIINEPFFRMYNSSVSAGSSFRTPSGTCSGGELASWNNNTGTNPSGDFGAGTQLNALAALGITGFASAQTNTVPPTLNGPPTQFSFANTTNVGAASIDSPQLGGKFVPAGSTPCLAPPGPASNSVNQGGAANATISALDSASGSGQHSYSYNTDLTLGGGTVSPGDNLSIFVTGNVYISSGIFYLGTNNATGQTAVWSSATNVPSFTLTATGNIYVSPSVAELDGVYTAIPDSAGNGSKIYTCSDDLDGQPFKPMPAAELYGSCHRQLTVYGSFVANQVNLMRTFGSLRDETPRQTSVTNVTKHDDPVKLLQYSCAVGDQSSPYRHSHWYATMDASGNIVPAIPATCPSPRLDNVNNGYIFGAWDSTFTTRFNNGTYWLLCEDVQPISGDRDHYVGLAVYNDTAGCLNDGHGGQPLGYVPATNVAGTTPLHENYDGPGGACVIPSACTGYHYYSVTDTADDDGGVRGYVYTNPANGDMTYQVQQPVLGGPPILTQCSNEDASSWLSPQTCAAEVFNFSPELYLSNPATALPNNGALQAQSITSLPPVL